MSKTHKGHDAVCQICEEAYECLDGFSCPSKTCDSCGEKMNSLQPAAQDLFEIVLRRIARLEGRKS